MLNFKERLILVICKFLSPTKSIFFLWHREQWVLPLFYLRVLLSFFFACLKLNIISENKYYRQIYPHSLIYFMPMNVTFKTNLFWKFKPSTKEVKKVPRKTLYCRYRVLLLLAILTTSDGHDVRKSQCSLLCWHHRARVVTHCPFTYWKKHLHAVQFLLPEKENFFPYFQHAEAVSLNSYNSSA